MIEQEIKITSEIKKLAKEYLEECPYLHNKEKLFKELLEQAAKEHKTVLEYLKNK